MRRTILLASVAALALGFGFASSSAIADVDVLVTVNKDKDICVNELITITKEIDIIVEVDIDVLKAAEANGLINQANFDNDACENCAEKIDQILDSVNQNEGIASVNQSSGNNNNQGSVLTAAIDSATPPGGGPPGSDPGEPAGNLGYADAQAHVDQRNGITEAQNPRVEAGNAVNSYFILFRQSEIIRSVNGNGGLTMVNQATGQMNNQANNVAIAVALAGGGVALSESDLGQETANSISSESDATKVALIDTSVNFNRGVTLVNQSSGNMGNQANELSVGAALVSGIID